jgi:hypothetical protein
MAPKLALWVNKAKIFLCPFERKFLRKIYGPAPENGCYRRRKYSEMYKLYDEHDDVKFISLVDLDGLDM